MKQAIKIIGIIYAVLMPVTMIIFAILGAVYFVEALDESAMAEMLKIMQETDPSITLKEVQAAVVYIGLVFLVIALCLIPGFILDIVILAKNAKVAAPMGKVSGILLGVFAILFGAGIPGLLQIIKAATSHNEPVAVAAPAEEVKAEEVKSKEAK